MTSPDDPAAADRAAAGPPGPPDAAGLPADADRRAAADHPQAPTPVDDAGGGAAAMSPGPAPDAGPRVTTLPAPAAPRATVRSTRTAVRIAAQGLTRVAELILIGIGLCSLFVDLEIDDLELLLLFDLLALVYLTIGFLVVRRQRRPAPVDRVVLRHRFRFDLLFSVTAALIGLYSAVTVAESDPDPEYAEVLNVVGVLTVALSWLLLHAGHARHYRNIYARIGGGLEWPVPTPDPSRPPTSRPAPRQLDFVYFAFTIGTSFGASDVVVTERRMRWSVLLHSCLSFFFNAAVLAFLVSRLSSL